MRPEGDRQRCGVGAWAVGLAGDAQYGRTLWGVLPAISPPCVGAISRGEVALQAGESVYMGVGLKEKGRRMGRSVDMGVGVRDPHPWVERIKRGVYAAFAFWSYQ